MALYTLTPHVPPHSMVYSCPLHSHTTTPLHPSTPLCTPSAPLSTPLHSHNSHVPPSIVVYSVHLHSHTTPTTTLQGGLQWPPTLSHHLHTTEQLKELLYEYSDQCIMAYEHSIDTQGRSPVHVQPYRLPFSECQIIDKEVAEMLKYGIIEKSSSPYSSPVILIKRRDGGHRFCIDFCQLNCQIAANHWLACSPFQPCSLPLPCSTPFRPLVPSPLP